MAFGKEENEAIRKIVSEEIQDILRREFSDLKAIRTEPRRERRMVKPKRVGRTQGAGIEHGLPGSSMGGYTTQGKWPGEAQDEPTSAQGQVWGAQGQGRAQGPDGRIGPTVPAGGGSGVYGGPQRGRRAVRVGADVSPVRLTDTSRAHEIARALAEAQFELSHELHLNLRMLKEVITHSQTIAQRIQTILGRSDAE